MTVLRTLSYYIEPEDLMVSQMGRVRSIGFEREDGTILQFDMDPEAWELLLEFFSLNNEHLAAHHTKSHEPTEAEIERVNSYLLDIALNDAPVLRHSTREIARDVLRIAWEARA